MKNKNKKNINPVEKINKNSLAINKKNIQFVCSILALVVLMFIVDSIFFGIFLWSDADVGDDNIWRARSGVLKHLIPSLSIYFTIAIIIAILFKDFVTRSKKKGLLMNFLKAGLLIGLLIGTIFSGFYIVFPINLDVLSTWFGGSVIFGILAGFILYIFNQK